MRHPVRRTRELTDLCRAAGTIATPQILSPPCSLNRTITSSRSLAIVRLPLEQVHDVARAFDATINDVLLTTVAGGVRRLLDSRGELAESDKIQVLVPVGLTGEEVRGLRNGVSALCAAADRHRGSRRGLAEGVRGGGRGQTPSPGLGRGNLLASP